MNEKIMINGNDLIRLGYRPGKWFGEALEYVNAQGLADLALKKYLDSIDPKFIWPHEDSVPYHRNIVAEDDEELATLQEVDRMMRELMKTPTLVDGAIMPDACPTKGLGQIPVGGVAVAEGAIHPGMHSADICCSVMMSNLGFIDPKKVLDIAQGVTHFGPGGRTDPFLLPSDLQRSIDGNVFLRGERSKHVAITHLGTQGDGNHFLYVGQLNTTGETILVTHHGSRGFGAELFKNGMIVAERFRREISPRSLRLNAWIPYDEEEGKAYWEALQIMRAWTKLNHTILHEAVCRNSRKDPVSRFWNEHNFVFKDGNHFYHAKGATPLQNKFVPDSTDGLRLIPLNMSEPILIVKGERSNSNLGFAPHGAGRNISRSQHKRNLAHRSDEEIFATETAGLDIRFFSGNIDISELPSAYKNADQVKRQMKKFGLGEVVDEILPYGCIMAGDYQRDAPWLKKKRS